MASASLQMWILGGTEYYLFGKDDKVLMNDVWYSEDGEDWTQSASGSWDIRYSHVGAVLDGKLWIYVIITLKAQRKYCVIGGISKKPNVRPKSPWIFSPNVRVAHGEENQESDYCQYRFEPFIDHSVTFPFCLVGMLKKDASDVLAILPC